MSKINEFLCLSLLKPVTTLLMWCSEWDCSFLDHRCCFKFWVWKKILKRSGFSKWTLRGVKHQIEKKNYYNKWSPVKELVIVNEIHIIYQYNFTCEIFLLSKVTQSQEFSRNSRIELLFRRYLEKTVNEKKKKKKKKDYNQRRELCY